MVVCERSSSTALTMPISELWQVLTARSCGLQENQRFSESLVEVTAEGRAVLRGESDHIELSGIDRWLGGVHLQGHRSRRWNRTVRAAIPIARL
jgi:hypothetical protein